MGDGIWPIVIFAHAQGLLLYYIIYLNTIQNSCGWKSEFIYIKFMNFIYDKKNLIQFLANNIKY